MSELELMTYMENANACTHRGGEDEYVPYQPDDEEY